MDNQEKDIINKTGFELSESLKSLYMTPEAVNFYGKITFNYFDGHYVSSNVEESIKPDNLNKGAKT